MHKENCNPIDWIYSLSNSLSINQDFNESIDILISEFVKFQALINLHNDSAFGASVLGFCC